MPIAGAFTPGHRAWCRCHSLRAKILRQFRSPRWAVSVRRIVPQWDFLDFITEEAARYPTFGLRRNVGVIGLEEERGAVRGVRWRAAAGEQFVRADMHGTVPEALA